MLDVRAPQIPTDLVPVGFIHFRLEYLACPLFASVASFRLQFQSVLLTQQMFVPANKLEISVVLLLLFKICTHTKVQASHQPSSSLALPCLRGIFLLLLSSSSLLL